MRRLSAPPTLHHFKWANRLLVVSGAEAFPPSADSAAARQIALADPGGFDERDLLIVYEGGGVRSVLAAGRGRWCEIERDALDVPTNDERSDFSAILFGRDGTEKARWHKPVEAPALFGVIDEMPMRHREMAR